RLEPQRAAIGHRGRSLGGARGADLFRLAEPHRRAATADNAIGYRRMLMLKGRIAIVTGSTGGIGLGIATALAAEGCDVMLNGFGEPAAIEQLRAGLAERHGVRAAYLGADVSKPAEIRDLVGETARRFGTVDILVNNAGIQHVAKIVDFPEERWDAVIAINLSAAFHATKAALPLMIARRWGRVINIASAHGLVASG